MTTKPIIFGAAAALAAVTLSGCATATDTANQAVESARAVVSSAASQASDALTQAQERAASAASQAQERAASAVAQATSAASEAASALRSVAGQTPYTMDDVKAHNKPSDCWVAIDGRVYDLTSWRQNHPGGADKIEKLCGTDGTDAFTGKHSGEALPNAKLRTFQIGVLS